MSHVTGTLLIDAPASALNNAGEDTEIRADNAVAVKFIRTAEERYPYVSAQAVRYWLRTQLAQQTGWTPSPTFRDEKIAYADGEPTAYAEDDLFGYMRAPKMEGEKNARVAGLTPLEEEKRGGKAQPVAITRTAPFRVGTLVAVAPTRITRDQGFMVRTQGDPVPHTHQFYRAHLKGGVSLDLTCAGTLFSATRAGFKNLDKGRVANASRAGAVEVHVRGLPAWRLPIDLRRLRVALLIRALGQLDGGAKQVLHLTDTAPSALVLAVCRNGNQPLQRLFTRGDLDDTVFRPDVLEEALWVFGSDLESDIYVGWARGFLDEERRKLEAMLNEPGTPRLHGKRVHVGHPRQIVETFAQAIEDPQNATWFD